MGKYSEVRVRLSVFLALRLTREIRLRRYLFQKGEGVPKDATEAVKWYRKAAVQGNGYAQNALSLMYFEGDGVAQNYAEAYLWANLAAAGGQPEIATRAKQLRDDISGRLTRETLITEQRRSSEVAAEITTAKKAYERRLLAPMSGSSSFIQHFDIFARGMDSLKGPAESALFTAFVVRGNRWIDRLRPAMGDSADRKKHKRGPPGTAMDGVDDVRRHHYASSKVPAQEGRRFVGDVDDLFGVLRWACVSFRLGCRVDSVSKQDG